jgi:hypothetical protein
VSQDSNTMGYYYNNRSETANAEIEKMMALPSAAHVAPQLMSQAIRLVRIGEGRRSIRRMLVNQGVTNEIADTVSRELTSYRHKALRRDAIVEIQGGFGCVIVGIILTAIAYYVAATSGESRVLIFSGVILLGLVWMVRGFFRFLRYLIFR